MCPVMGHCRTSDAVPRAFDRGVTVAIVSEWRWQRGDISQLVKAYAEVCGDNHDEVNCHSRCKGPQHSTKACGVFEDSQGWPLGF